MGYSCRGVCVAHLSVCVSAGSASGGDASEAVSEHTSASAGGRAEQPEGAAGGGGGGQEEPGETAQHHAGAGTHTRNSSALHNSIVVLCSKIVHQNCLKHPQNKRMSLV